MAVNTSKTKFVIFRTRGKLINDEECVLLFNNNEPGQPADPELITQIDRIHNGVEEKSFKLLGVLFDEYLSFNSHIQQLCSKISKSLFCINRIKKLRQWGILKTTVLCYGPFASFLLYQCI